MSVENKKEVIYLLQQGDRKIMQTLFNLYYIDLCKVIFPFVKSQFTAEDIVQNVFLKLWEKRDRIEIKTSIKAYLRKMAINEAITFLRKSKRTSQIESAPLLFLKQYQPSGEEKYIHDELKDQIHQAIDGLPPRCSLIFKMSRFEELSYREIADQLDISIKTVENQMGKALRILRMVIKKED